MGVRTKLDLDQADQTSNIYKHLAVEEQSNFTKQMPGRPLGLSAENNCPITSWDWNDANCTTKYSSCVTKDSYW